MIGFIDAPITITLYDKGLHIELLDNKSLTGFFLALGLASSL
jgi:hypothetical protein